MANNFGRLITTVAIRYLQSTLPVFAPNHPKHSEIILNQLP
jgi:hypothetical protein